MPHRLMIVEDDGDVLEAMQAALRQAGFGVNAVRSGRAALDALRGGPLPDLLLVDFELPDMNALELVEEKTRWERSAKVARVPALIVSGHDAFAGELELERLPGVVGALTKPFEPDELCAEVRRCLGAAADPAELLARALVHSQRAVRAREDLLAVVCHDLRVPLTTVSMTAANMLSAAASEQRLGERQADLERVLRAARQMRRLVRDLLDFSQLEAGQLRVSSTRQPLAALVAQAIELARPGLGARRLALRIDGEIHIGCDRARLLQLFGNLLGNACQHTPENAVIEVRVARDGEHAVVSIDDDGPGISEQDLPRVFDPYRRRKPLHGDDGGLGLGLCIASGIALAHGGTLTAARRAEGGTSMVVRLPCDPALSGAEPAPILLVDDDESIRVELADLLEHEGYRVVTAADGKAAWSYLRSHPPPALALLDLMMPQMDGWELLAAMKRDAALSQTPAVIVSALDARRVEPSLLDIAGYLEKPIRLPALLQIVREHAGTP